MFFFQKREGLLKDLSCADEEEISSTSIVTNWPATADPTADPDTASDTTTEENTTAEHEIEINQPIAITATSIPQYIKSKIQYKSPTKFTDMNNFNKVAFGKDINLGASDDHNIQSNFIPKHVDDTNVLIDEQLEKLEDERHMQHKMLHEEMARVGNVDNIFTQPADHFIPPLVMAKSRMNDDMTVLSLAEKHAQQLAEKQFSKHIQGDHSLFVETSNNLHSENSHNTDKPLIAPVKLNQAKESKSNNLKSHVPKKYVNEKYYESKEKAIGKLWQSKPSEINKPIDSTPIPITTLEDGKAITLKDHSKYHDKIDEDFAMDLKVMLNDAPLTSDENIAPPRYTGDVAKLETITKKNLLVNNGLGNPIPSQENSLPLPNIKPVDNNSMEHEVIQITVISNDDPAVNTTVFEITTKMPIFRDDSEKSDLYTTPLPSIVPKETYFTESIKVEKPENSSEANQKTSVTTAQVSFPIAITETPITVSDTTLYISTTTEKITTKAEPITPVTVLPLIINRTEITEMPTTMTTTYFNNSHEVTTDIINKITTIDLLTNNYNDSATTEINASSEQNDFNHTEVHDLPKTNMTDPEEIIYDDSPLLSGAYEPVQRPPRTRRPQQQNRKFNPFRILG